MTTRLRRDLQHIEQRILDLQPAAGAHDTAATVELAALTVDAARLRQAISDSAARAGMSAGWIDAATGERAAPGWTP